MRELTRATFIEGNFYLEWAKKAKNFKTKRKLLLKAKKEVDRIYNNKEIMHERIRRFMKWIK